MEEQDMQNKVKKVSDKLTDSVFLLANEPSVALFRLQEHVRKSLPEMVQHKANMQELERQSQGMIYDVDYACGAVTSIGNSSRTFKNIEGMLKKSMILKDQLNKSQARSSLRAPCFPDPSSA
uniref:BLOC-1-related complex subunit 8 n=1 Tax=Myxine glutinosa TaxID=7769 RepID=UPI00358FE530